MRSSSLTGTGPAQDAPPAIKVEGLCVDYEVRLEGGTIASDLGRLIRREENRRKIPAVSDVSFEVPSGSVFAIIGRNGAGKSTLLRALAGILVPSQGRIVSWGRTSLFAIGLGFNRALTGRENIRLGGLAQGIEPERIDEMTDQIAEFAQLGEFIDYPINSYSTGMRSRLGFAVASHLEPDILLIDEALTGGDAAYKERASARMQEMCSQGRTIVLVTHGLSSVGKMAHSAMWLHQGKVKAVSDDPNEIVNQYMRYCRLADVALDDAG